MIQEMGLRFVATQDQDSQWNTQFPSYSNTQGELIPAASFFYQGTKMEVTYEDGTKKTADSYAVFRQGADFSGVNNGEDFYNRFCNPEAAAAQPTSPAAPQQPAPAPTQSQPAPTISGYPVPIVRDSGADTTSGYFLDGEGYEDVAVLSVLSFEGGSTSSTEYLSNFQSTVADFLQQSKDAGKQRLVIDLSTNGGGFVVAGYELFAQMYPDVTPFQADNMRLTDSLADIARITDGVPNDFQPTTADEQQGLQLLTQSAIISNLVPGGVFSPDGQMFATVDDIIAPVKLKGDTFTAYQNTPLNMTDSTFNLTGVGNQADPPPAAFDPDNVVILTDGNCASTCTIFSYLMIMQMGVRSVAVGGRPQKGPMQSIAGVEGAQVFSMNDISDTSAGVLSLAPADQQEELRGGMLGTLAEGYALSRASTPSSGGSVNGKNAFSSTNSQTPLQFLYQPANGRFFYTKEMVSSPEATWKRAVDCAWTNPDAFCVDGSVMPMAMTAPGDVDPVFELATDMTGRNTRLQSAAGRIGAGYAEKLAALLAAAAACGMLMFT